MPRQLPILLSILLAASLAGCGSGGGPKAPGNKTLSAVPKTVEQKVTLKKDLPPRQFYEPTGGFSFDPPPGWEPSEVPGRKYRSVFGPPANGFRPNIAVSEEESPGTLNDYISEATRGLREKMDSLKVLKRDDYETQDGVKFARLIVLATMQGREFRQYLHFLADGSRRYGMMMGCLAEDGEKWDKIILQSMKTFRLHLKK